MGSRSKARPAAEIQRRPERRSSCWRQKSFLSILSHTSSSTRSRICEISKTPRSRLGCSTVTAPAGRVTSCRRTRSGRSGRVRTCHPDAWTVSGLPSCLLLAEAIHDGQAPVAAEGARRDLHADGTLPALVLVAVHHADDPADRVLLEAQGHQLGDAAVLLDVGLE